MFSLSPNTSQSLYPHNFMFFLSLIGYGLLILYDLCIELNFSFCIYHYDLLILLAIVCGNEGAYPCVSV